MAKTKVALVFGQYRHPIQPYLATWAERLDSSCLDVQIFDFSISAPKEGYSLRAEGRFKKTKNFFHYVFVWPSHFIRWLFASNHLDLKEKLSYWVTFGPLIAFQPDVIHLVNSYIYPKFGQWIAVLGTRCIVSFRGHDIVVRPWVDGKWLGELQNIFSQAKMLHFVSYYLSSEAQKLGADIAKCKVIYPSTSIGDLQIGDNNTSKEGLKIVSTGRLTWQKGFPCALLAIKQILEKGIMVNYSILGEGYEKEHLSYMIRTLGLEKSVHLVGYQTQEQVNKQLAEADIYFHPSETEAIPVAIMEAAIMGKAIVASNVGGIPEAIENEVSGLLVAPYDTDAMVNALISLIHDPQRRLKLGQEAKKRATGKFLVDLECREWESVYRSLAKGNNDIGNPVLKVKQ